MGEDTSLTVEVDAKEQVDEIRPVDQTWTEFFVTLRTLLDSLAGEETECRNCDRKIAPQADLIDQGGVIYWERVGTQDGHEYTLNEYFCSPECGKEWIDSINEQVPREPDEVIVGGRARPDILLNDATYLIDGESRELSINIPGAFSVDGADWVGEPVYIRNGGRIVQTGGRGGRASRRPRAHGAAAGV